MSSGSLFKRKERQFIGTVIQHSGRKFVFAGTGIYKSSFIHSTKLELNEPLTGVHFGLDEKVECVGLYHLPKGIVGIR